MAKDNKVKDTKLKDNEKSNDKTSNSTNSNLNNSNKGSSRNYWFCGVIFALISITICAVYPIIYSKPQVLSLS